MFDVVNSLKDYLVMYIGASWDCFYDLYSCKIVISDLPDRFQIKLELSMVCSHIA
jgi:hypothetical protein